GNESVFLYLASKGDKKSFFPILVAVISGYTGRAAMKRSLFSDLRYKAFQSGNPLYFFIAVNVLVFITVNALSLFTALRFTAIPLASYLLSWLQLPAAFEAWVYKPWTLVTYMF